MTDIKGWETKVHEHGFVRVVDTMGDDAAIVQAARVSYGEGTKEVSSDQGLIPTLKMRSVFPIVGTMPRFTHRVTLVMGDQRIPVMSGLWSGTW